MNHRTIDGRQSPTDAPKATRSSSAVITAVNEHNFNCLAAHGRAVNARRVKARTDYRGFAPCLAEVS